MIMPRSSGSVQRLADGATIRSRAAHATELRLLRCNSSKADLSKIPVYPGAQTVGDRPHADPSTVQGPKVRRLFGGGRWIRTSGTAAQKPWISAAFRAWRGIGGAPLKNGTT